MDDETIAEAVRAIQHVQSFCQHYLYPSDKDGTVNEETGNYNRRCNNCGKDSSKDGY